MKIVIDTQEDHAHISKVIEFLSSIIKEGSMIVREPKPDYTSSEYSNIKYSKTEYPKKYHDIDNSNPSINELNNHYSENVEKDNKLNSEPFVNPFSVMFQEKKEESKSNEDLGIKFY